MMIDCTSFSIIRTNVVLFIFLVHFACCTKISSPSNSLTPSPSGSPQADESSSQIPYHSPAKLAAGLRKSETHHARQWQRYSDKIGTTTNLHHQAMYDSQAEKSFLKSRKSARKAEKLEKVAKALAIDAGFPVRNQPRTRSQARAKSLSKTSPEPSSTQHSNGNHPPS